MNKDRLRRRARLMSAAQKSPSLSNAGGSGGFGLPSSSSIAPDHSLQQSIPLPTVVSRPTTELPTGDTKSTNGSVLLCRSLWLDAKQLGRLPNPTTPAMSLKNKEMACVECDMSIYAC